MKCIRGEGGQVTIVNPFGRGIRFDGAVERRIDVLEEFKEFMSNRPMILCRTNKQVRFLAAAGYYEASTVHQAKGLEYNNVLVIDSNMTSTEDLNIAYVALTRARDGL